MPTPTRLECAAALSDLVLQAARAAIPAHVDSLMPLPDCGPLNRPLMPLLVALLDAAKVTASAINDNAWDSGQPIPAELTLELVGIAASLQQEIASAAHAPTNFTMPYLITYRKNNETVELEWIAPSHYGTEAIRRAFYRQFSGAEIISIKALGEGCLVG